VAEDLKNQQQEVSEKPEKVRRSGGGFWLSLFILFLLMGITAVGAYILLGLQHSQESLDNDISREEQQILDLSRQVGDYQAQLTTLQKQLVNVNSEATNSDDYFNNKLKEYADLHNKKLDSVHGRMDESLQKIQRQLGKTRGDWLISDAEYLLSIANQRLHLTGDIKTTKEALMAADQRLLESDDAGVFKVRQQLAKEISAVKKLTTIDLVGIYNSLQVLADNIENLTLLLPYAGKQVNKPAINLASDDSLDKAWLNLEGLITIRRTETAIGSILTKEQADFIKQQLSIKLEIIKIAVVQHNVNLYQTSIHDVKQWLQKNFSVNENAQQFTSELDRLNAIAIKNRYPEINQSLNMLRDVIKLRIETDKALDEDKKQHPTLGGLTVPTIEMAEKELALPNQATKKPVDTKGTKDTQVIPAEKLDEPKQVNDSSKIKTEKTPDNPIKKIEKPLSVNNKVKPVLKSVPPKTSIDDKQLKPTEKQVAPVLDKKEAKPAIKTDSAETLVQPKKTTQPPPKPITKPEVTKLKPTPKPSFNLDDYEEQLILPPTPTQQ